MGSCDSQSEHRDPNCDENYTRISPLNPVNYRPYFQIKIHRYPLATFVDSESNRTLLNREGIKVIRTLDLAILDRVVQICMANE